METDAEVADLRERLRRARSVSVLTGSGISAESGLPTFRGPGGLWRSHRVEELASPAGFARDPDLVWTWYNERRLAHRAVEPSPAHVALARLEERCADFTLITQNVDSLHLRAGSRNVLELHGKLREAKCTRCDARRPFDDAFDLAALDHDGCGGTWRPDIVWFGEPLPREVLEDAFAAARRAELMLVVGTSGIVQPAASLATKRCTSAHVVEVNPEDTALTPLVDRSLRARASDVLPLLV
ncbi:MAG TPA: NAD-dependent deacylase [Candidatus Baltobacteraceae bacterium]|nr:NAD-dependent deacylase [Candidatus Baltobacteraceae bacterium]